MRKASHKALFWVGTKSGLTLPSPTPLPPERTVTRRDAEASSLGLLLARNSEPQPWQVCRRCGSHSGHLLWARRPQVHRLGVSSLLKRSPFDGMQSGCVTSPNDSHMMPIAIVSLFCGCSDGPDCVEVSRLW